MATPGRAKLVSTFFFQVRVQKNREGGQNNHDLVKASKRGTSDIRPELHKLQNEAAEERMLDWTQ